MGVILQILLVKGTKKAADCPRSWSGAPFFCYLFISSLLFHCSSDLSIVASLLVKVSFSPFCYSSAGCKLNIGCASTLVYAGCPLSQDSTHMWVIGMLRHSAHHSLLSNSGCFQKKNYSEKDFFLLLFSNGLFKLAL